MKLLLLTIALMAWPVLAAETIEQQPLLLYETDLKQGKYVFSRNYQAADGRLVSSVTLADTFEIKSTVFDCKVVMTNARVFTLEQGGKLLPKGTNAFFQAGTFVGELTIGFPKETKLIYKNKVVELSKAKIKPQP